MAAKHSIFITNLRFWLILVLEGGLLAFFALRPCASQIVQPVVPVRNPGQMPLPPGLEVPHQRIKNTLGGVYSVNATWYFMNSPYRVQNDIIVQAGVTIKIETGVQIYFDTGVGMKVYGTIIAIGNEFAHIQMLPYQQQLVYDNTFPDFKLIDGPSVRQGRLQVKFRDRWRGVCTQLTNWTSVDTSTACKSMGYSDGAFYKWFLRNNDTFPFVMPAPDCRLTDRTLWDCDGFSTLDNIPLSENLCQGEDDIGIYCWGQPSFTGWARHWKGLQIFNSPFKFVNEDPDQVSMQRESLSRLEFLDILYAGYDGSTRNATPALYIEGVPPIMNGLRVHRSARDGIYLYEAAGPIVIANSTVDYNRGHGIAIDNTTDGRAFINMTLIQGNYGDGIFYSQRQGGLTLVKTLGERSKRQSGYYEEEKARIDMCLAHSVPTHNYFPHLIKLLLKNGTALDPLMPPLCWMTVSLPHRLPYTYTLQFLGVTNLNPPTLASSTQLIICDANDTVTNACSLPRYKIPIRDGIFPQSVSLRSSGNPIYIALQHDLGLFSMGRVVGDIDVSFKLHASVTDKAFYGLNVTHSVVHNNTGNGVLAQQVRERTALWNVTVESNEGLAGFLVRDGAADLWVNDTSLSYNWGDGMNVSYAGGSINVNGSRFLENRWRGFVFHQNTSLPFLALRQEIIIKGRPGANSYYPETIFEGNLWGGVVVGNFCLNAFDPEYVPRVQVTWSKFLRNRRHPALEVYACRSEQVAPLHLDVTGNVFQHNTEVAFRMQPAVNVHAFIESNKFFYNNYSALVIKNSLHPQLKNLVANVTVARNEFKFNEGPFIVSVGLNENAPRQFLSFSQQNEIGGNRVYNPYPFLRPRSTPYAALIVSSSNVLIRRNCFRNPMADYEIGTELMEHAKVIDAKENNWGFKDPSSFMNRIFDQFNRYSLASIDVNPYAAVCNERVSHMTLTQQYYRQFRSDSQPYVIGGAVYENHDLTDGKYTVVEDLHILPGAKLTLSPGTVLEFVDGVGMLVQGELLKANFNNEKMDLPIVFTSKAFSVPRAEKLRLVDEYGNDDVTAGRLEVLLEGQWGTVCNRSWTQFHAQLACNQLGLTMDPQYFENWRIFVDKGDLPMVMDNVRCEENDFDLTRCRHDGVLHNVAAGCRATEVVGLRCAVPHWAGVRYSLLANPPLTTDQPTMHNWLIERAGMFDFRTSSFSPALQLDWNYHSFRNITVRNNYHDGIDIVYNDLTRKPSLRQIHVAQNRGHGIRLRSVGITVENVLIEENLNAGVNFNPRIHENVQRDIVSWLDSTVEPNLEANNIYHIPRSDLDGLNVFESQLNQRKFLVARETPECPRVLLEPCNYTLSLYAAGHADGLAGKLAVQIINRANNESDEDALFYDYQSGRRWSVRHNVVQFPIVSGGNRLRMTYTRSVGRPKLILLVHFLDSQEYLDRFVHVYESVIQKNQYGASAVHYSNLTFEDGTVLNRQTNEKIWFQKVNFTENRDAVVWIHSPQHEVKPNTELSEITWHIDNCSIHDNFGPIIDTHRDLFESSNIFHWIFWSNTFANNSNGGVRVHLPDTYNLLAQKNHTFWMTENRFEGNRDFLVELGGYFVYANISSNNFTDNFAAPRGGILSLTGMEKQLIMERNRFFNNHGHWLVKMDIASHSLRWNAQEMPAFIQYNYFEYNWFLRKNEGYVDSWPRSFAVGVFGAQKADVHFNRLSNPLMDFEVVAGAKPHVPGFDSMNITHNWWGRVSEGEIAQRVFDVDDWNSFTVGEYSPFFSSREHFLDFWWDWHRAQLFHYTYLEPPKHDLHGRMFQSKTLTLDLERWPEFPFHYRPYRPYRITRDLTVMPGATLTIEAGVEVHIWPNVRILVLGDLIADATLWQPVRFLPINTTEAAEQLGRIPTRYKRSPLRRLRDKNVNQEFKHMEWVRKKRGYLRAGSDPVVLEFPKIRRDDPFFQTFSVSLTRNSTVLGRAGFLQLYNATTGETVPSCDRQFTRRNAQVVCRELGFETQNVYTWVTPRWDYNPHIRLVKTYMEPRECVGTEMRLDQCNLRLTGNDSMWMCMDNEHFNYVHCGSNSSVANKFVGSWGGIAFGSGSLELSQQNGRDSSLFRHVEIVGGGQVHNDSFQAAALTIIRRNPLMENLNVTNSSMHGVQIVSPRDSIVLTRLNISDNLGQGVSILSTNLKASSANAPTPQGPLNVPYDAVGLLNLCAAGKRLEVLDRVIVYFKYDGFPVDCVKVFSTRKQMLSFRLLQVNLYGGVNGLGRSDHLSVFSDPSFAPASQLHRFTSDSPFARASPSIQAHTLAIHFRGTAADGEYGFLAEVSAMPSTPDARDVEDVAIRNSRFINNDRGALEYRNTGEIGPSVLVEQCAIDSNGYFLYGNISTSAQAMELHLHNTLKMLFRGNAVSNNRGGLLVTAQSSSIVAQLLAVIKNNGFLGNSNSTVLAFLGNNYQKLSLLNNVIALNYALYFDTVIVKGMSANFSHNLVVNNTGLNTIDTAGYSRVSSDAQVFERNYFEHNRALGHQLQYAEAFGYQPDQTPTSVFELRPPRRRRRSVESQTGLCGVAHACARVKRQVISQKGVSFDWWTHVGTETERYRSTVLAGSSNQRFSHNVFNNPANPFELTTTVTVPQFDTDAIDARDNYWGYPGTIGVAAGKIRDQQDFPYLIKVNYIPVLDSNTSLIEGDCPAGWFQAGVEEFKSCFLFVGAAQTYENAVRFCEAIDAFIPILRNEDVRQKELASRIDAMGQQYETDLERYLGSAGRSLDIPFWISSVTLPSNQCGFMNSRSGEIRMDNCNNQLPFVCEKGTKPYNEPVLWRRELIFAVVIACVLVLLLAVLVIGWCLKSRRRDEDLLAKKQYIRESIRRHKEHRSFRNQDVTPNGDSGFTNVVPFAKMKPIRAHDSLHREPPPPASSYSGSGSSKSTESTVSSDRTYSAPTATTRTCTDSLCTDNYNYSEYTQQPTLPLPRKNLVSAVPNPYSEISTFRQEARSNRGPKLGSRRDTDLSGSSCTTCSGIYSLRTCTCSETTTERESTITEEGSSWGENSSSDRSSETTLTERPLLGRTVITGLDRSQTKSSMTTLRASSRPDLSTNRSYADFFKGSGRPSLTSSRSNPALYQQAPATPVLVPVPPPRANSPAANLETYDREPGFHRPRQPSWHSTMDPRSDHGNFVSSTPVQRGNIPVYNPNPDLKNVFTYSPPSNRSTQISMPSPGRPRQPPPERPIPSRSLVDLYSSETTGSRRHLIGSALETSM